VYCRAAWCNSDRYASGAGTKLSTNKKRLEVVYGTKYKYAADRWDSCKRKPSWLTKYVKRPFRDYVKMPIKGIDGVLRGKR
jgi:hypothetical protein